MEKQIKIAAVGDNCIDLYDTTGEGYPGGNPVNVAVYVKRLGGDASYTGAVGTDQNGKKLVDALHEKGVDTSHVQVLPGKTAVSHVKLADGDRVFGAYSEGVLADFRLRSEDVTFICQHDLAVTGIWGMIEKDLPEISKKIPVAFDFANKFMSPVLDEAIPYVTYGFFSYDEESKPDFEERYRLFSLERKETQSEKLLEFMKEVGKRGPRVVVVTLGEKGSLAWDGEMLYHCGIVPCDLVDTMGAGDSFIAGFLYGILQGKDIRQSMQKGAENSAVTIGYFGAW